MKADSHPRKIAQVAVIIFRQIINRKSPEEIPDYSILYRLTASGYSHSIVDGGLEEMS